MVVAEAEATMVSTPVQLWELFSEPSPASFFSGGLFVHAANLALPAALRTDAEKDGMTNQLLGGQDLAQALGIIILPTDITTGTAVPAEGEAAADPSFWRRRSLTGLCSLRRFITLEMRQAGGGAGAEAKGGIMQQHNTYAKGIKE